MEGNYNCPSVAPPKSKDEPNYSITVLVYTEEENPYVGFWHFKDRAWYLFGCDESTIILAWAEIGYPSKEVTDKFIPLKNYGYRETSLDEPYVGEK